MNSQLKQIYLDQEPTHYYISSEGKLFNKKTQCWYKGRVSDTGYLTYVLRFNNKQYSKQAHRLVAEAFLENSNNLSIVNHKDGNKLNNNVENLEWVTQSQNVQHTVDNNLRKPTYSIISYEPIEQEEWRSIFNSDKYKVSNFGRVLNTKTNRILVGKKSGEYIRYELTYDGVSKNYLGHRLVYYAFHPDFDIFDTSRIINHIDGNKQNNTLTNLEECNKSQNALHAYYISKTNSKARPVVQYDIQMNFIKEFPSAGQAAKITGIAQPLITAACQRQGTSHGFNWRYKES